MSRTDIKQIIKRQDDEVYGENTIAGSSPDPESDDDTADSNNDYTTRLKPGDDFYLADEVLNDDKPTIATHVTLGDEEEEEEEEL
ncbi:hypothetical protein IPM62_03445 [Candidatus Woesebacteria bacterium]|nr:MAG: hypothetical protein IPM62_03445 [Candidatus Woesebacteria bacterium]